MLKAIAVTVMTATTLQANPAEDLLSQSPAPGASIAIWDGDTVTTSFAGQRAKGASAPIQADDLWHIGSNTKAMTATLVARLVEAGAITWDDTIGQTLGAALPDIHAGYRDTTYAQLLTHRSGIPANEGIWRRLSSAIDMAPSSDIRAARRDYAAAVLKRAPSGTGTFRYSNAGYVVAGAMLEARTGEPWEALMQAHVFAPLGITTAGFGPPDRSQPPQQPQGHAKGFFKKCQPLDPDAPADNPDYLGPAGTVHLSIQDYMKFVIAHAQQPDDFLSAESWAKLHQPVGDYAMGWGQRGSIWSHAGSNTMWYSLVAFDPDGWAIIANINCGDGSKLTDYVKDQIDAHP